MNYSYSMSPPVTRGAPMRPVVEAATLAVVARRLYTMRRARDAMLGSTMFSEPAWDILLDLFVSEHDGRQLSVSAVCIGARSPSATALRYLTMLQESGQVERIRDVSDGRRSHVRLTAQGRRRMTDLLEMLV